MFIYDKHVHSNSSVNSHISVMILTGVHDICKDHFYANYYVQQTTLYLKTDIRNYSHKVS
jgi:predicted metal-dependent TIM-barrel fold hydrolase